MVSSLSEYAWIILIDSLPFSATDSIMMLDNAHIMFQIEHKCLSSECLLFIQLAYQSHIGQHAPSILQEPPCFSDQQFAIHSASEVSCPVVTCVTCVGEEVICFGLVAG
jgi:hypothetical protein